MGFSVAVLFCFFLAASVSYSTLLVRPINHESPVITLIGMTREITSSECKIIQDPNSLNVPIGSTVNFTVITVNCTVILLNFSGEIITSFRQFDLGRLGSKPGDYIEGLYTISNITLENDGDTIQFLANGRNGGDFASSEVATLRVQGPPGPVTDLSCHFSDQDQLHMSFTKPHTLLGVKTSYFIEPYDLSEAFTTDNSKVNVTVSNVTSLDKYKAYNITITSFNAGSMGTASNCTVFIPNATQIATSAISVVFVNHGNDAIMNLATVLLNTTDKPLCPGCYPDTVRMYINEDNSSGHIRPYEFAVPSGETKFCMRNISVKKNALLSANIYYCNVAECVLSRATLISTFDLQRVQVKSIDNGSVCVSCVFTNGSIANACVIQVHIDTDEIFELIAFRKNNNSFITECYNVRFSHESYDWGAFAAIGTTLLSSYPAFTGNLTIQPRKTTPSPTNEDPTNKNPDPGPNFNVYTFLSLLIVIIFILIIGGGIICVCLYRKNNKLKGLLCRSHEIIEIEINEEQVQPLQVIHCEPHCDTDPQIISYSTIAEENENEITEHVDDTISLFSDSTDTKATGFKSKPPSFTQFNKDAYRLPPSRSQPSTPITIQPPLSIGLELPRNRSFPQMVRPNS